MAMTESDKKVVADILGDNGDNRLSTIMRHARLLQRINQQVQQKLPLALRQFCQVANLRQRTLVIIVDNAAFAT